MPANDHGLGILPKKRPVTLKAFGQEMTSPRYVPEKTALRQIIRLARTLLTATGHKSSLGLGAEQEAR